jgi:hypothetical protein
LITFDFIISRKNIQLKKEEERAELSPVTFLGNYSRKRKTPPSDLETCPMERYNGHV